MKKVLILLIACTVLLVACSEYQGEDCTKKDPKAIFDSPDMCWSLKAQKTKNIEMCDKVSTPRHRSVCLGRVAGEKNLPFACKDMNSEAVLKKLFAAKLKRTFSGTPTPKQLAAAEEAKQKQLTEMSRSETRHCIYLHYNQGDNGGRGSDTPPDNYLEYGKYAKE
ncbi:MAG: hypothetical protein ACE5FT_03220 [Candidatus Nanoarchaeia archaeon]